MRPISNVSCAATVTIVFAAFCCAAHAYKLTGMVLDTQAKPVPGASVWLNQDRNLKKAECTADGTFSFDDVAIGPAEIVAWKEGYACGGLDARVAGDANISIALGEPDSISVRVIERRLDPRTAASTPPSPIVGASVLVMFVNDAFHVSVEDLARLGFPNPRSDGQGELTIAMPQRQPRQLHDRAPRIRRSVSRVSAGGVVDRPAARHRPDGRVTNEKGGSRRRVPS